MVLGQKFQQLILPSQWTLSEVYGRTDQTYTGRFPSHIVDGFHLLSNAWSSLSSTHLRFAGVLTHSTFNAQCDVLDVLSCFDGGSSSYEGAFRDAGDLLRSSDRHTVTINRALDFSYPPPIPSQMELRDVYPVSACIRMVETAYDSAGKLDMLMRLMADGAAGIVFKDKRAPYEPGRGPTQVAVSFRPSTHISDTGTPSRDHPGDHYI